MKNNKNIPDMLDNIDINIFNENIIKYNKLLKIEYLFKNIRNNFLNYY
tara:strand:+ start:410 stop:553 length:144 start_codon:yes stop_codon:yes gene_type:complete